MHHLPTGAQFAAMLASNQTQVAHGRSAGALPDYPTFVNNLFKELPLVDLPAVTKLVQELAAADPDGKVAQTYKEIARKVAIFVAQKAADHTAKFPNIVIQNT